MKKILFFVVVIFCSVKSVCQTTDSVSVLRAEISVLKKKLAKSKSNEKKLHKEISLLKERPASLEEAVYRLQLMGYTVSLPRNFQPGRYSGHNNSPLRN